VKEDQAQRSKVSPHRRIAVYPGSFDPITLGHVDIIKRVSPLFDSIVILIAQSPNKKSLFSIDERTALIKESLAGVDNFVVDVHTGLTIDYLKKIGSQVLVRGLRAVVDFEYEVSMANINRKLAPEIETILVFASPEYYFVSSRAVKEVALHGGSLQGLVPAPVGRALENKMNRNTEASGRPVNNRG
jgi:pantetheine-phosphate adenylyltransferase